MKTQYLTIITLILSILGFGSANAAGESWKNHAHPHDFLFGNDFDTHQQTRLNRKGELAGFLYVTFTGALSQDGFRVATHRDCNVAPCAAGWELRGKPAVGAIYVYHEMGDHHTFLVERADIPQPGTYSHFHWSGSNPMITGETKNGFFLELKALDTFCFVHHQADMFDETLTCEDDTNNGVIVRPGEDIATHVNIVGSYPGFGAP